MTRDEDSTGGKLATVAHDVRDKASSLASSARERGSDLATGARDSAGRAVDSTSDLIRSHPFTTTALALGAGALIGVMLPRVRIGMAATSAARKTAKMVATAETVKTVAAMLTAASERVRASAHELSDRVPDLREIRDAATAGVKDVRDAAAQGVARAGDAVGNTGRQVADGARKVGERLTRD